MIWNIVIIAVGLVWLGASMILQSDYMLVALLPIVMFVTGYIVAEKIAQEEMPKNNSWKYFICPGYATGASMRSQETWRFANQHCGDWYMRWSVPVLVAGELLMCFFQHYAYVEELIFLGQLIFVVMPIFLTERAVEKTFDRQGRRK